MPVNVRVMAILAKYLAFGIVPVVLPPTDFPETLSPTERDPNAARHRSGLHPGVGRMLVVMFSTLSRGRRQ